MIIKDNMAVICRTREEQEIYMEIASKEGWRDILGGNIEIKPNLPMNYATGYYSDHYYPNGVSHGKADKKYPSHLTVVEASDLFRNQLIARRVKHEKGTT